MAKNEPSLDLNNEFRLRGRAETAAVLDLRGEVH